MTKQVSHKTAPARLRAQRRGRSAIPTPVKAVLLAFGCGTGAALLLLAVFAFLCDRFSLPVAAVRPLALAAAWAGAMISGYVLGGQLGRQRLLCGLACGVFYCLCQLLASYMANGSFALAQADPALPIALVLGGIVGGTASALRASGTPRP